MVLSLEFHGRSYRTHYWDPRAVKEEEQEAKLGSAKLSNNTFLVSKQANITQ